MVTDIVIVGRTNRAALLEGCRRVGRTGPSVKMVDRREEAVAWAQAELGPGTRSCSRTICPTTFPDLSKQSQATELADSGAALDDSPSGKAVEWRTMSNKRGFSDRGAFGVAQREGREAGLPARVAVIYGGPSPEHDVSMLTGLQAVHALQRAPGVSGVRSLYWSKSGDWYEVPAGDRSCRLPRRCSLERRASRIDQRTGRRLCRPGSGLRARESRLEIDAAVICCHGGPGEDGSLQGALDLTGLPYTGPTAAGAALGMDKLAFAALMVYAGLPALARVPLDDKSEEPPFAPPYILKPRFGGSSIGIEVVADFATARARLVANSHLRRGAVLEPYHEEMFDLQLAARSWPELQLSAIERPLRTREGGEILGYQDKYVGSEGMTSAPRGAASRHRARTGRAHLQAGDRGRLDRRAARRRAYRLSLRWGRPFHQRDQHHPGLAIALFVDRPPLAVRHFAARPARRGHRTPGGGLLLGGLGRVGPAGSRVHREQARMSGEADGRRR